MHQRLTRRQLAQIAIAGTAGVAIGTLANKTKAQQPNLAIVGMSSGPLNNTDTAAVPEVDSTEEDSTDLDSSTLARTSAASTNSELILQSLDVGTGQVQNLTTQALERGGSTSTLEVGERISDLTSLADGTLVGVINTISTSKKGASPTRLTFLGTSTTVTVSGLKKNELLESLLVLKDGSSIGLVARRKGTPPVDLVNVNVKTGEISKNKDFTLPANVRYSNLAQCPDGKIYTTSVGREGDTHLVLLDEGRRRPITVAQLRIKDIVWNNGLFSLACSSAGQLFALGAFWHETTKSVYTVNATTGEMTRLSSFDAARITVL